MAFQIAAFADEAGALLSEQIEAMRRNGVALLEMRGVDGENCAKLTIAQGMEVKKRLDDAGIRVWSMGSPYGKIGIQDDFAPHLQALRGSLQVCNAMGIDRMRMFSFFIPQGESPDVYREEVLERMDAMLLAGAEAGVLMCHENEKGIYGDDAQRCLDLYKTFKGRMVGIFDPANFIQCGQDMDAAMDMLLDYVDYVHIKDARLSDGHVVPAGHGDGKVAGLLKRLKGRDMVTLTVEPHLKVFDGLKDLERSGEETQMQDFLYPDGQAAFDAACDALKVLLANV